MEEGEVVDVDLQGGGDPLDLGHGEEQLPPAELYAEQRQWERWAEVGIQYKRIVFHRIMLQEV